MKTYNIKELNSSIIKKICSRAIQDDDSIKSNVANILKNVKENGDKALYDYTERFDKVNLKQLYINKIELKEIAEQTPLAAKQAIDTAYQNIYKFHSAQQHQEEKIETMEGVVCWRENRAIESVGLYIPGGTAVLPSTLLMLGIPAKIAGCKEIVVCSPPLANGKVNCYIAYVAQLLDLDRIYLVGGSQAIAAMAYGTESIPQVYKIFGPGNRYVTEAKKYVQNIVAIDMPAGPSEVLVIADENSNPAFVASDLLAQAEHGIDSQAVLVTTSEKLIQATVNEIKEQLELLPRKAIAEKAIENSFAVLVENLNQAFDFSNQYAPEHLILALDDFEELLPLIQNAGSVFLGNYTPESVGDYASGTNHTLPTSAFAKSYSGVSLDTFIKKITFQHLDKKGIENIGKTVEILAEAEGLTAHKNAVSIRLNQLN